ncbi:MAG: hypothetical protein ACLQU3_05735 [Limisphaerales bacterium]
MLNLVLVHNYKQPPKTLAVAGVVGNPGNVVNRVWGSVRWVCTRLPDRACGGVSIEPGPMP